MCISLTAKKFGVTDVPVEAVTFISHATQSRLRTMVEKISIIAQHRLDSCKVSTHTGQIRSIDCITSKCKKRVLLVTDYTVVHPLEILNSHKCCLESQASA